MNSPKAVTKEFQPNPYHKISNNSITSATPQIGKPGSDIVNPSASCSAIRLKEPVLTFMENTDVEIPVEIFAPGIVM